MLKPGKVEKIEGEKAWVRMQKGTSCGEHHCPLGSTLLDDSGTDFYKVLAKNEISASIGSNAVSYTHLDVYKRQELAFSFANSSAFLIDPRIPSSEGVRTNLAPKQKNWQKRKMCIRDRYSFGFCLCSAWL